MGGKADRARCTSILAPTTLPRSVFTLVAESLKTTDATERFDWAVVSDDDNMPSDSEGASPSAGPASGSPPSAYGGPASNAAFLPECNGSRCKGAYKEWKRTMEGY
eukprot:1239555-Prorocentrum_lima.AAC.1